MEQPLPTSNISNIIREFEKSKGELALSKQELQDKFGLSGETAEIVIGKLVTTGYFMFGEENTNQSSEAMLKLKLRPEREKDFFTRPKISEEEVEVLEEVGIGLTPPFDTWRDHIRLKGGHVIELRLVRQGLRALPETIGNLSHLKVLNLRYNYLRSLPLTIKELTQLVVLNLGNNHLEEIPLEIYTLPHLRVLRLEGNESLKDFITNGKSLHSLWEKSGGVFEEIADLMGYLLSHSWETWRYNEDINLALAATNDQYDSGDFRESPEIFFDFLLNQTNLKYHIRSHPSEGQFRGPKSRTYYALLDSTERGPYRGVYSPIYVVHVFHRGSQQCPFARCDYTWTNEYLIFNSFTERFFLISRGTEHLAREHQVLEGMSTIEFYHHFAEPMLRIIQEGVNDEL